MSMAPLKQTPKPTQPRRIRHRCPHCKGTGRGGLLNPSNPNAVCNGCRGRGYLEFNG